MIGSSNAAYMSVWVMINLSKLASHFTSTDGHNKGKLLEVLDSDKHVARGTLHNVANANYLSRAVEIVLQHLMQVLSLAQLSDLTTTPSI